MKELDNHHSHNSHKAHKPYRPHKNYKTIYRPFPHFSFFIFLFSFFILFTSCEKAEQLYSNNTVRFIFENTQMVPQLNTSLNNPGEFCTISAHNNQWIFSSPSYKEDFPYNITERDLVRKPVLGLNGLIVGVPFLQESNKPVCFDRACRKCYEDFRVTRALTLQEGQRATCGRCHRTYNLNNLGISDDGAKLYQYPVQYGNNNLIISNN